MYNLLSSSSSISDTLSNFAHYLYKKKPALQLLPIAL